MLSPKDDILFLHSKLGLTASLVSQFFSREFCGKWDSLLAKISVRVSWVSRDSWEGKNAIYCELASLVICESRNLRDSQTSKIIIYSKKLVLDPKFSQDSRRTLELKFVMILAILATNFLFARLASLTTKFVCETRKKRVLLQNFVARLASHDSCYKICVCETRKKQVSLLILTRENLARILA